MACLSDAAPPVLLLSAAAQTVCCFCFVRSRQRRELFIQIFFFFLLFSVGYITTYIHDNFDNAILNTDDEVRESAENELFGEKADGASERVSLGGAADAGVVLRAEIDKVTVGTYSKRLMLKSCTADGRRLMNKVVLEITESDSQGWYAQRGDCIEAAVVLAFPGAATNPGQFDSRQYYKSLGYAYYIKNPDITSVSGGKNLILKGLESLKLSLKKVYGLCCTDTDAGVYEAMVTGDKSDMDESLNGLFSAAGIGHILAISGLHISMIGMGVFGLLRRIGFMFPASAAVSGILVVLFGTMTGSSVSAVRAIVMFVCSVGARALGRKYDILSAVSLSAIILMLKNPYIIMNSGFLLSFMAIAGVAVVSEGFDMKWLKWLTTPFAIWLATLPVLLWFYYEIPVYSILLNLFVVPLMSLIMISALGCGFIGLISIPAGIFFAGTGHYILLLFRNCCELMLSLPGSILVAGRPKMWQVVLYYALLMLFSCRKKIVKAVRRWNEKNKEGLRKRTWLKVLVNGRRNAGLKTGDVGAGRGAVLEPVTVYVMNVIFRSLWAAAVFIVLIYRSRGGLEITFLDIGQGDAIFVSLPDGTNIFIDGGSTSTKNIYDKVIEPFLKYKGVRKLDFLFITHSDSDHENGWSEALWRLADGQVYIPKIENLVLNECDYESYIDAYGMEVTAEQGLSTIGMSNGGMSYESAPNGGMSYERVSDGGMSYERVLDGGMSYERVSDGGVSYESAPNGGMSYERVSDGEMSYERVLDGGMSYERVSDGGMSYERTSNSEVEELKPWNGDRIDGFGVDTVESIAGEMAKLGSEVLCAKQGDTYRFGECSLTSLNDCRGKADYVKDSENDNSIVLLLRYKGFSALFTGDLTSNKEVLIAEQAASYGIDSLSLLKVAHHGSKYSSGEKFLSTVKPQAAVISCSANNSYGHPHAETVERIEAVGAVLFRTDISGAVTVEIDEAAGRMEVFEYVR